MGLSARFHPNHTYSIGPDFTTRYSPTNIRCYQQPSAFRTVPTESVKIFGGAVFLLARGPAPANLVGTPSSACPNCTEVRLLRRIRLGSSQPLAMTHSERGRLFRFGVMNEVI